MKRAVIAVVAIVVASVSWAAGQKASAEGETILRIGTPNVVSSANIFGDYYLGIFAHLSNPPLMKMNQQGILEGLTAEGYEVSEDNTTWSFTIRDNLYWSDGRKVTAEDVRFSIEYTGQHNPSARWIADALQDTEVVGERTVRLTFSKPYTRINLEFATYNILPMHVWQDITDPMQYTNTGANVGCGPFVIESIDMNAGIVRFGANAFWRGAEPSIDGIEIHMYKNMDVLSLALERGDVDTFYKYASSYPYANAERLRQTGRFTFSTVLNTGLVFLGCNLRREPVSDLRFREAISLAIDYQEILKLDALGFGQSPARGFVPPSMGGHVSTAPLTHDPAKSRELLRAAGYRDTDGDGTVEDREGKALRLTILVRDQWSRLAELVRDYLAEIGIASEIRSADLSTWVAAKDEYDYDLTITRTTPWGMLMHANWGTGYFDARRTGRGVLHTVDDPEFLSLTDRILSTSDESLLLQLAKEVQEYYAEQLPAVALYWNMIVTPSSSAYGGWMPDPLYGVYNTDTFLSVRRSE